MAKQDKAGKRTAEDDAQPPVGDQLDVTAKWPQRTDVNAAAAGRKLRRALENVPDVLLTSAVELTLGFEEMAAEDPVEARRDLLRRLELLASDWYLLCRIGAGTPSFTQDVHVGHVLMALDYALSDQDTNASSALEKVAKGILKQIADPPLHIRHESKRRVRKALANLMMFDAKYPTCEADERQVFLEGLAFSMDAAPASFDPLPGDFNPGIALPETPQEAGIWLRDHVASSLEYFHREWTEDGVNPDDSNPLELAEDFDALPGITAVNAVTNEMFWFMRKQGTTLAPIAKHLPEDYADPDRMRAVRKCVRTTLWNLDEEPTERMAESLVRQVLRAMGYPNNKAKELFRVK